jgi:hypothetical protein
MSTKTIIVTLNLPTTRLSSSSADPVFFPRYKSNVCSQSLKPLKSFTDSSSHGYTLKEIEYILYIIKFSVDINSNAEITW